MPLDPDAEAIRAALAQLDQAPMETLAPAELRARTEAAVAASALEGPPVGPIVEREVGGVACSVVTPLGEGPFDVLVWFHGGGWVIGSASQSLHTAKDLAAAGGVVVVLPEYRLAPEDRFPAAFDDSLAVTTGALELAGELGGPGARVAVGGDSAGGNLAALAALIVPGLVHQILAYPVTDATMSGSSYTTMAGGYILTAPAMRWFVDLYVGTADPADWRISPLFAPRDVLAGAPPAHVIVAGYDPLASEGEAYAQRLEEAGISVSVARYDGQMHGFLTMGAMVPTGARALEEAVGHLRRVLDA